MKKEIDNVPNSNEQSEILDIQLPTEQEKLEVQGLLHKLPEEMLLEALMERNGNMSLTVEKQVSQQYSGPIPPPSMLSDYDNVQNGFAERIVSMAENEQKHRHSLESASVQGAITKDKRSQNYALICVLFLAGLCGGLIYNGHDVAGSVLGGSTLVGLTALFITGRRDTNKKGKSKSETPADDSATE